MDRIIELDEDRREFYFSKIISSSGAKKEKISFWNQVLKSHLWTLGHSLNFTFAPETIGKNFVFKGNEPDCILQIIDILLKDSVLRPRFNDHENGLASTILSGLYSAAMTIFTSLSSTLEEEDDEIPSLASFPKEIIHFELLEECCSKLFKYIKLNNTLLMDKVDFTTNIKLALGIATIDEKDVKLMERLLIKQNRLLVGKHGDSDDEISSSSIVYKFHLNPATIIAPITEIDFGRLALKRTAHNLAKQIATMHLDIDRFVL